MRYDGSSWAPWLTAWIDVRDFGRPIGFDKYDLLTITPPLIGVMCVHGQTTGHAHVRPNRGRRQSHRRRQGVALLLARSGAGPLGTGGTATCAAAQSHDAPTITHR